LEDKTENGLRTLRLILRSLRQARCLVIIFSPKIPVEAAELNGKNIYNVIFPINLNPDTWRRIEYEAPPPGGIELLLKSAPMTNLRFT